MGNEQSNAKSSPSSASPYHPHIAVVNPAPVSHSSNASNITGHEDSDLTKLATIPKFLPILRSSINLQNDPNQLPHMVTGPVREATRSIVLSSLSLILVATIVDAIAESSSFLC